MRVRFSPQVRAAFADLAASVHLSGHFDADVRSAVEDWARDKTLSVSTVLKAFPAIAEETSRHIQATGDQRATDAWGEIRTQMPENGFTLSMSAVREK